MNASSWQQIADKLSNIIPASQLDPTASAFLRAEKNAILLACSAGADSVLALLLVYAHFPKLRPKLSVVHYNHALRGVDADSDQRFASSLAESLELDFISEKSTPQEMNDVSEATLRDQRFEFFKKTANKNDATTIVLGHQKDDILESMLMRLARGSGSPGLAAPRPVQHISNHPTRVRPLLSLSRDMIRSALSEAGATWQEDKSNNEDSFLRNRIRRHVIPELSKASTHDPLHGAARARQLLEEDDDALNLIAANAVTMLVNPDKVLDASRTYPLPRAVSRRVLALWLAMNNRHSAAQGNGMELLLNALDKRNEGSYTLHDNTCVLYIDDSLRCTSANKPVKWTHVKITPYGRLFLPNGDSLCMHLYEPTPESIESICSGLVDDKIECHLNLDSPKTLLRIRRWNDGDRYHPLGAPGSRKLQDCFTDRKVPADKRHTLPIVCSRKNEILWAPGLPPAEGAKLSSDTKWALRLTYIPV